MIQALNYSARIALLASLVGFLPAAGEMRQTGFNSHQVNPDGSLTLRYYAPTAKAVTVSLDYDHNNLPLKKGDDGVWTLTTAPLKPELHVYGLNVDGTDLLDPLNPSVDTGLVFKSNTVRVRGAVPELWDVADVPHGVVHHHAYRSAVIKGLVDGQEDFFVYTPPGYDPAAARLYPVLYLLHGWSATAQAWTAAGEANVILDNLIAQGRALPMIVVMPQGYGDMGFVTSGFGVWNDESAVGHNLELFRDALLSEILPQVEAGYRVARDPDHRAIAGLSMGGGQSLVIGLSHPDTFAWVGGFSSAVIYDRFDGVLPNLGSRDQPQPRLVWIACGTGDQLIAAHRKFAAWLREKGVQPTAVETPGIHNWPVWRDNLIHFAPLLFR